MFIKVIIVEIDDDNNNNNNEKFILNVNSKENPKRGPGNFYNQFVCTSSILSLVYMRSSQRAK